MRTERQEVITEGRRAHKESMNSRRQKGPWIYYAKVKSGVRATRNIQGQYTSIPHLKGEILEQYVRENENFSVFAITRIMKGYLRSQKEDI